MIRERRFKIGANIDIGDLGLGEDYEEVPDPNSPTLDKNETVESLSEKILPYEHEILPKALQLLCSGKIIIHSRDVEILPD